MGTNERPPRWVQKLMNQPPDVVKAKSSKDLTPAKARIDPVSSERKSAADEKEKTSHPVINNKNSPYNLRSRPAELRSM